MLRSWSMVRTFNGDTKRVLTMWACVGFAYFGVMGVLVNLYLLRLGFGVEFIGLLIAAGQLLWAMLTLPAGMLSRRFGLRPVIVGGVVLAGVSMALFVLVELLPQSWWAPWIFVCWLLAWAGGALYTGNSTPFMMLAARPEERNHAFAAQAAISATFGFVGGILAGLLPAFLTSLFGWSLDDPAPYRLGLWLVPITYTVATVVMSGASPLLIARGTEQQVETKAPVGIFTFFVVLVFLQTVGGGAARSFFNVFLDTGLQVSPVYIGAIMGLGQLLPVFVSILTPTMLQRLGTDGTMVAVGVVMGVALVAMGLTGHWLIAGIAFAVIISMNSVGGPARNIFSQEIVPLEWRSISAAINTLGLALGWAASAALGGYLIGVIGFRSFFFLCAVLSALSVPVLLGRARVLRLRPQMAADD